MKKRYFAYYPRNFANEYKVIAVQTQQEAEQLQEWFDRRPSDPADRSLEPVTVAQLRRMAAKERRARREDLGFAGYCAPWNPLTLRDLISA